MRKRVTLWLVLAGGLLLQQAALADSFDQLRRAAEARQQEPLQERRDDRRNSRSAGDAG